MPKISLFILVGIFLWLGMSPSQASEEVLEVEDPRYHIRQVGKGEPWYDPLRGGRVRFTFVVNDIISGSESTFVLDNLSSEIHRLEILGEKLLIVGQEATSKAVILTIVGLRDRAVEDTLMGFWPEFSPDRRYVVFRKYFSSKNADPPKRSDLVLLYDLEKSAEENRVRGLKAYRNDPIGLLTEVGLPVFPDTNARKKRYRVWVREEDKRHSILPGGFFWPDGENRIVFIDRSGASFYLIVVNLKSPDTPPMIHRGGFDPLEDDRKDDQKAAHAHGKDRFTLEKVEVLKTGDVQISLMDREGEEQTWQFPPEAFVPPLFP